MTADAFAGNGAESAVRALPDGYAAVMPFMSADTAEFLSFVKKSFGAEETVRILNDDGSIGHAEAVINRSVILMFDASIETRSFLRLTVEDARATFDRAIAAGATPITEVTYLFWVDEVGRVRDPFGNIWWLQGSVTEVDTFDLAASAADPRNRAAMRYVQDSLGEGLRRAAKIRDSRALQAQVTS